MKRRGMRGKAYIESLAQSLIAYWGEDYRHTEMFCTGSDFFKDECRIQFALYQYGSGRFYQKKSEAKV